MAFVRKLWSEDDGQGVAEYAIMMAVVLTLVIGTVKMISSGAIEIFSAVANSFH